MDAKSNPTLTRRRQRRPDLQTTFDIPEDVQQHISSVADALRCSAAPSEGVPLSAVAAKVVTATDKALRELLLPSLTPAQQLHAISKVTGAIKDLPKAQLAATVTTPSGELYAWGRTLALEAVVPMLLDCRVRYLHRALMTLLRTLLPTPDAATEAVVREMYVARVLRRAATTTTGALADGASAPAVAAATLYFPTETEGEGEKEEGGVDGRAATASRDTVMHFLNSVDGLTSTLMPMMPSIFKDTFLEALPLLAECFQWVVVNATSHSRTRGAGGVAAAAAPGSSEVGEGAEDDDAVAKAQVAEANGEDEEQAGQPASTPSPPPSDSIATGTVFGEDLEHIRFCVRVVATYIHKYMDALTAAMVAGAVASPDDVSRQLARLLQPTVVMLASPIFPKDVLNAVGLLVASILTVRTCDGWLLAAVCAALRDDVALAAQAVTAEAGSSADVPGAVSMDENETSNNYKNSSLAPQASTAHSLTKLFDYAETTLSVVCAADPHAAAVAHNGVGAAALHSLFTAFTPNGCFALLKGILAHVSSPIRGDWTTFGILIAPRDGCVVAYDVILPAAQQFCNMVQEPETRFMAIQTVDSVVRHVNAVLHTAFAAVKRCGNEAEKHGAAGADASTALMSEPVRRHLTSLCTSTPKLQAALTFSSQLIMALWDDGTQQMSGALYGTYNEILKITETLTMACQHFAAGAHGITDTTVATADVEADTVVTLDQILDVQAERRGKYHALLGHLSMMPLATFIAVLQRHYHCESSAAAAVAAFARTLLCGASNHKIGNVAGDVFAQLARLLKTAVPSQQKPSAETAAEVLRDGIIAPLARAITEAGYVAVSSNVSEAVNISHITAHFVAPLVKQDATALPAILTAIVGDGSGGRGGHDCERVEQGVVEVLARARGVGVDIVPYVAPGSIVLRVLEASTHSLNYDVRNSALCLCVLGTKKIQAVQPWQLQKVEEYLVLNMHLGGDSTARKGLLEMLKKWVRRLTESYASKGAVAAPTKAAAAEASTDAAKPAKKARQEVPARPPTEATGASPDLLELGTPAYRNAVLTHCARLAAIFAQNIGVSLRASLGLAVERRVTAMLGYTALLQGLRTLFHGETAAAWTVRSTDESPSHKLLHTCVVPSLIATLSDGWSQARDSAKELLHLLCDTAPAEVLAMAAAGTGEVVAADGSNAALSASLMQRAHQDLLKAQTYRNAEGAVQRFLLYATRTATTAAAGECQPLHKLSDLSAIFEAERTSIVDKCTAMAALRGGAAYAYIHANPLHGSLSLCAELLGCMAAVEHQLSLTAASSASSAATAAGQATLPDAVVLQACTSLLQCCCVVLRTCSSLVGTETVTAGATAGLGENEVVDCRGHVYDRSRPEAESVMRGVVNNTWLSMRVATTAVERVLKVRAVHLLPFTVVRAAAYELVHALLLTKHNGVMRCVREALKALAATLVRSREPQFYQLPAELLNYLLGPEGVTSGDMARMLRRSQGLPHAMLAVLEAEDTAVPYSLFPLAMRQLTRVARGDAPLTDGVVSASGRGSSTAEEVRRSQRSNALNVLKFVFEDKVFADRVVAYIEEAFSLATEGFHDASWYTRNSSLMLFSAVIHRFVGEHPSTGGSGVNTSLHDVAKRTPRGVAYAYAELTRGNGLVGNGAAASGAEVNVALFPVLQLLSMLAPDPPHLVTKASHSEWDDTARMSDAVLRCAASPSLMVRSASAVALCCLVPITSLTRVIAQTRRGLALRPCEGLVMTDAAGAVGSVDGGLNACHGALLQLLQFHAQYVGTVRRHYKQKRSSYATPAVAESVCRAICDAVLSCQAVLVRVCAVCPTVAASLFALLADLVHFAPQQHITPEQQHALRGFCLAALAAYMAAPHGVLERGSVLEGASAMVVFMAVQRASPVGAWTAAEQQSLTSLCQHEAAALAIRRGDHNLVSWIAAQLIHYSGAAALLSRADVVAVLQVLAVDVQCNVASLVFASLEEFFARSAESTAAATGVAGETSAAVVVVAGLGCIAWGQLVTHLRFAATAVALLSDLNKPSGEEEKKDTAAAAAAAASSAAVRAEECLLFDSAVQSASVHELHKKLIALLAPPASASEANTTTTAAGAAAVTADDGSIWNNSDACSAALDFVTSYDIHATPTHSVSTPLAAILAFYAEPEQPLESRLAVVTALRTSLPFLRGNFAGVTDCAPAAVTLLLVLLRLLVDDTSDIREAAATICSHALWGPLEAPRDQVTCLLAVARLLRRLRVSGQLQNSDVARSFFNVTVNADAAESEKANTAEEDDAEADDGSSNEGDTDEDVLFQKEAANMFAEETVLLCLYGHVFDSKEGVVKSDVAVACDSFTVFDSLLQQSGTDAA